MQLFQIPISHNCVKVRRVLELKGLAYETVDIAPMDRGPVVAVSGQGLVPILDDAGQVVAESTAILRYLEARYPDPPLIPADPAGRAECWLLEDWADAVFMALTRRIAYWQVVNTKNAIENLFFPSARGLKRRMMGHVARKRVRARFRLSEGQNRKDEAEAKRLAALAIERLGGRSHLVGEQRTLADVNLAVMSAPLWAALPEVRDDANVRALLTWGESVLGSATVQIYKPAV